VELHKEMGWPVFRLAHFFVRGLSKRWREGTIRGLLKNSHSTRNAQFPCPHLNLGLVSNL